VLPACAQTVEGGRPGKRPAGRYPAAVLGVGGRVEVHSECVAGRVGCRLKEDTGKMDGVVDSQVL
jgi:hypothetical protein